MKYRTLLASIALVALAVASPASAIPYAWTLSGYANGSGTLTTDGIQAVTGITGTLDGNPITGLSPYASADNLLLPPVTPAFPWVDFSGISFSTLALGDWNIFWDGSTQNLLSSVVDPGGYPMAGTEIAFDVRNKVPEPSTLAIFGAGLFAFMMSGRKNKRGVKAVVA